MSLPAQDKKNKTPEKSDATYSFHKDNFLRVSHAAKILGVSPSTVRRFEEEGLITSYRNPKNNYRSYRLDAIKELKRNLDQKKVQKYNSALGNVPKEFKYTEKQKKAELKPLSVKTKSAGDRNNKSKLNNSLYKHDKYEKNTKTNEQGTPWKAREKISEPLWRKTRVGITFWPLYYVPLLLLSTYQKVKTLKIE